MPGRICAVAYCKSNQIAFKKRGLHITFHCFPKDNNLFSSTIRKEWVQRCKRGDKFNSDASAICSLHFTQNDYERDLQNELLGLPLRHILKKTAIPTLCLNDNSLCPTEESISAHRSTKIKNEIVALSLAPTISQKFNPSTSTHPSEVSSGEQFNKPIELQDLEDASDIYMYKKKYEDLLQRYNILKVNSRKQIKGLNDMLRYYKNKYYSTQQNKTPNLQKVSKLKHFITKN